MRRFAAYPLLFCAAICTALYCCSDSVEYRNTEGPVWGTYFHITYASPSDLGDTIAAQLRGIDHSLSTFTEGSLLHRLNEGEDIHADSHMRDVFRISCHVCSISGGAFDPTVAPLVNLWGFGYRKPDAPTPPQSSIDSALCHVGLLDCGIAEDGSVLKKTHATEFDFSAVAKGYGVDCVAASLRNAGCTDYMVEIGGEVALSGHNSHGEPWVIQVDSPVDDLSGTSHTPVAFLQLTDACLATSGNYRNYRDTPEGRVGHTISPVTGRPIATSTLSATVVAPDCGLADALATACMAMDAPAAMDMIEAEPGVECMLVSAAEDSTYTITLSSGFSRLIKQ